MGQSDCLLDFEQVESRVSLLYIWSLSYLMPLSDECVIHSPLGDDLTGDRCPFIGKLVGQMIFSVLYCYQVIIYTVKI